MTKTGPVTASEAMILDVWRRAGVRYPDPTYLRRETGVSMERMKPSIARLVSMKLIDLDGLDLDEALLLGSALALVAEKKKPHPKVCMKKSGLSSYIASLVHERLVYLGMWPEENAAPSKVKAIQFPPPKPVSKPFPKDVAELLPRRAPLAAKVVYRLAWKMKPNGGSLDYKAMLERSALNQCDTWAGYHWLVSRGLWMWKHVGGAWRSWKPMTSAETRMYRVSMIPA